MRTNEEKKEAITAIVDVVINFDYESTRRKAAAMIDVILNEKSLEYVDDEYQFTPCLETSTEAAKWLNNDVSVERLVEVLTNR